ncbi:sugar kinase [Asticcacaulis sp. BYS171W]|uniref:Sugar kinase n=1 Tax=Asticcacaulis aquaticus TaxID=2984212 RepID=A0ABT5HTB8_9CAUL|nr:sugar kinase [Asticcacaulis aquaticus]MDC7682731.1 sugar kinase [Asticcacaulis aquaticus]
MSSTPQAFTCFGELLIRLSTSGRDPLYSLPELTPFVGGAEANVAVGLARLGHATRVISVIPDNDLGHAAAGQLRFWGVDASRVTTAPGRMGLYFLTTGGIHRPSDILYDRAGSAFAEADFAAFDWAKLLAGSSWLHVSGVTAALGLNAFNGALRAMQVARTLGIKVSFDCNYRPKLWEAWGGDARALIPQLMAQADLIFGGYRDIELVFQTTFAGEPGSDGRSRAAADHAFAAFPDLQRLICTRREQVNVDHNRLAGLMYTRTESLETKCYDIARIIDRIGGGDAFAAGVLHGILSGKSDAEALDLGIAGGCLKHAMPGDFALATVADLEAFLSEDGFDVKR